MSDEETKCPNCGSTEFYLFPSGGNRWGVGEKWVCSKCGFKGTKQMLRHGNVKRQFNHR